MASPRRFVPARLFFLVIAGLLFHFKGFNQSINQPEAGNGIPEKFIFYWGDMQGVLLAANQYHCSIEVPTTAFRKSIFSHPFLWNGNAMSDSLVFKLEGQMVSSSKNEKQIYLDHQTQLDKQFGQNARAGETIQISDLLLGNGIYGSILITLKEPVPQKTPQRRFPAADRPVTVTKEWIDFFQWGPFIDEWSQRDYFTVQEVLTTIATDPVFVWNPNKVQEGMEVQISPLVPNVDIPQQVADLNGMTYQQFSGQFLKSYGHLIQPGMAIELGLRTSQQRHQEIRATMNVVAPDDPRLQLKRSKDGHAFSFQWGSWQSSWDHLYLKTFQLADGTTIHADPETWLYTSNFFLSLYDDGISEATKIQQNFDRFLSSRPSFTVDELEMSDLTFDIEMDNQTWTVGAEENVPEGLKNALIAKAAAEENASDPSRKTILSKAPATGKVASLVIKNIKGSSYFDFQPISFLVFLPLP